MKIPLLGIELPGERTFRCANAHSSHVLQLGSEAMELRTLKYFLTVVEEGSITNASKRLHVTQPTLSRQLTSLENEMGCQLYTRSHAGVSPTERGVMLAKYAESIVSLAKKAEADIATPAKAISGSVHIGCGETKAMELVAKAMQKTREQYPKIDFELYSGATIDLMDRLVRGNIDILLECELQHHENMNVVPIPWVDRWGVVVLADDPLANKPFVTRDDIVGRTLITSRQGTKTGKLREWLGDYENRIDVSSVYSLGLNSKFLVRQGMGIAFVYEGLIEGPDLRFVPLKPAVTSSHGIVWRKTRPNRQTQAFLDVLLPILASA